MLFNLLLTVALIAAAVSIYVSVSYLFRCSALEKHLGTTRPDFKADQAGMTAWQQTRWTLERKRVRVGLIGILDYAVGMAVILPLGLMVPKTGPEHQFIFALLIVVSIGLLVVGLRSVFHNNREFELDLKRRYPGAY